jgi:hypothetical protein
MMRRFIAILIAAAGGSLLTGPALAQDTNACPPLPQTRLEGFETNTGTVIIKASAPIGTVAANAGVVSLKCRDITEAGTGRHECGIVVGITYGGQWEDIMLIDYDELDPLLTAIDYISKLDWSVTSFPSFDAVFTTKGGFRIIAFGSRRTGAIEFAARSTRASRRPLLLSRDQVGQLRSLIEQAKAKLDSTRKEK